MGTRREFGLLTAAAISLAVAPGTVWAADKTVAITAIVEHPALDACREGIIEALAEAGYVEGENTEILFESAQGNPATAAQIARQFVGEEPDVIVPISTPSAQAVVAATSNIPVVFTAVTDPVGAKLVSDPDQPGGNVTGMSDLSPIGLHLDLVRELAPDATRLGVISNPGEANSVTLVNLIEELAPERGFEVVEASAPQSSAVLPAAQSLVGDVDVIYVPTDNTVVTALEAIVQVGTENGIPVIAGDTDSVPRGAVAALGFNYGDVGRQTGRMVAAVLNGANPGTIPVEGVEITELHVNPSAADAMGVSLSDEILERAHTVIE
ncbi:MAG: ABC transporter substrate-binding protein [Geminicoccaceae bacterium]